MEAKPKGKPKEPLTYEQKAHVTTLAAAGWSPNKIARHIGRSRHAVRNALSEPEIQRSVQDEKAELAQIYREKAREIVSSISSVDIKDASLQQKAVSSGILLDKALLLTGDAPNINVQVLLEVAYAIREERDERARILQASLVPALPPPEPES